MSGQGNSHGVRQEGPRLIALIGPFQSGKTKLFEALLTRAGAAREGTTLGDLSPEARAHQMSVEANIGHADYLGDQYTFIDLPGSLEFAQEARRTLPLCDAAIVVCEADQRKIFALQLILRELEELRIPRFLFVNKIDQASVGVRETLALLQPASRTPLLARQMPIWKNGLAVGFIDLALERAYVYREHAPSEVVEIPSGDAEEEKAERYSMLERLADYDDALMEELISDIEPPRDQVFDDLSKELRAGVIAPLFFGSALRGAGVTRLLKALRHEAPGVSEARTRLGIAEKGAPLARVIRTIHTAHGGKLSLVRVLRGSFADGQAVLTPGGEEKISGLSRLLAGAPSKRSEALEGDTLAFGRLELAATGDMISGDPRNGAKEATRTANGAPPPVHAIALKVKDRKDEMKLAGAMAKLIDEDPSLVYLHDQELSEIKLMGQGEMHLRVTLERLASRFGVTVESHKPAVAYKETIRKPAAARGRHKKQSGGHGQFGDVALQIAPRGRGEGFTFSEQVHGGAVPRQYFASVEAGCQDALAHGPLGFPVVDVEAVLVDGSYHTVDSSDMAFRTAARIGMSEALSKADSVLLEPVLAVSIFCPNEGTSRATAIVSGRRGQILGFGPREGWDGWDRIEALIPEADMDNLIVELRSATAGAGFYEARFNHLAELTGRLAKEVAAHAGKAEAHG
ncbi:MAG TPA: elongation factor G [Methylocystis sp.]|nr:elongation factor G [Methylocystis sp.]